MSLRAAVLLELLAREQRSALSPSIRGWCR